MIALPVALLLLPAGGCPAQDPGTARWTWGSWAEEFERPEGEKCFFRKTFSLPSAAREARAWVACDNHFTLWVNGEFAGRGDSWQEATRLDLSRFLESGENLLAIEARNDGGPAALLLFADVLLEGGEAVRLQSDATWRTSPGGPEGWNRPGFDDRAWKGAREIGPYGREPWTVVVWNSEARFEPLPGFHVEPVAEGIGSLIALALDDEGRILVSTEDGGVLRLSDRDGDGAFESTETFTEAVKTCHGLCWSRGALFAVGEGGEGRGLYRIDGKRVTLLGRFEGEGGEHGPHAVVEGPDGLLYISVGNHATIPDPWSPASPYLIHYEGHLLPRYLDPRGHALHVRSPAGTVVRADREGKEWQIFAGGFRNAYDLAFDEGGDLFTFDSDMEWDVGLPWYRPVRVVHVVAGGEYGSRTGSSVWPETYADSLPGAIDVGRGSPTGLCFYDGKRFPARFRGALLGGDWSQGRILAFHLEPRGASYGGRTETLLAGRPLNLTDLAVDEEGALLFSSGGRGSRGGVWRLVYDGPSEEAPPRPVSSPRREFDGKTSVTDLLSALSTEDRFLRFAAARQLERRDPSLWERAALDRPEAIARAEALVALARLGFSRVDPEECATRIERAEAIATTAAGEARLAAFRALELLLLDSDAPTPGAHEALGEGLLRLFPTGDRAADRELGILLAHLGPEGAVERILEYLEKEPSRAERIHFAYCLRCLREGWSRQSRLRFGDFLAGALRWKGGYSFEGYIRAIRDSFETILEPEEKEAFAAEAATASDPGEPGFSREGAEPRDFDETLLFLRRTRGAKRRSAAEGARVFRAACGDCHRSGEEGGGTGPDLTTVASRFTLSEILEHTLRPSLRIPDPYRATEVYLEDGRVFAGVPVVDEPGRLVLLQSNGERIEVPRERIEERRPSPVSTMPDGLLDALTLEEAGDLFAFLEGREAAPAEGSGWMPLFDGRSLAGWDGDAGLWSVEGGSIVGRAGGLPESRFLISKETFGDFLLEFDVRLEAGNSGLQFRSERKEDHVLHGYQADVGESYWGSLYEEGGRGMLALVPFDVWRPLVDERGWNHYVVAAIGERLRIELNGETTVDLRDGRSTSGLLGFQLHAGSVTRVRFRNVRIRTTGLPKEGDL